MSARLQGLARELGPDALGPALHELSGELLRGGYPRELLLEDLKRLALDLRAEEEEEREDDVVDVMNVLTGWCAPSARLEGRGAS